MPKKIYNLLLFLLICSPCVSSALEHPMSIEVEFYSEQLSIPYSSDIILKTDLRLQEENIVHFYKLMETSNYQLLLDNLKLYQEKLQLNDWLFYDLLRKTVHSIYKNKSELQKTLTCWFLLSKGGYDTRLTFYNSAAFVYVYSLESVFEAPMIQDNNRNFINVSSFHSKINTNGVALDMLLFTANPKGDSFSFDLSQLPKLKVKKEQKLITFSVGEDNHKFYVETDVTIRELMESYPIIDEHKYLEIPLSKTLYQSLIPQISALIKGKSNKEALETLVSFTRSAFSYKEDHDFFGKSKPMIADEVFLYPYSDCEDRSALFYTLVKELLDLPMLVIAYSDHLTIAVSIPEAIGAPIIHKKRKYYICDPTGPSNSKEIGKAPRGYEQKSFEILAKYK